MQPLKIVTFDSNSKSFSLHNGTLTAKSPGATITLIHATNPTQIRPNERENIMLKKIWPMLSLLIGFSIHGMDAPSTSQSASSNPLPNKDLAAISTAIASSSNSVPTLPNPYSAIEAEILEKLTALVPSADQAYIDDPLLAQQLITKIDDCYCIPDKQEVAYFIYCLNKNTIEGIIQYLTKMKLKIPSFKFPSSGVDFILSENIKRWQRDPNTTFEGKITKAVDHIKNPQQPDRRHTLLDQIASLQDLVDGKRASMEASEKREYLLTHSFSPIVFRFFSTTGLYLTNPDNDSKNIVVTFGLRKDTLDPKEDSKAGILPVLLNYQTNAEDVIFHLNAEQMDLETASNSLHQTSAGRNPLFNIKKNDVFIKFKKNPVAFLYFKRFILDACALEVAENHHSLTARARALVDQRKQCEDSTTIS